MSLPIGAIQERWMGNGKSKNDSLVLVDFCKSDDIHSWWISMKWAGFEKIYGWQMSVQMCHGKGVWQKETMKQHCKMRFLNVSTDFSYHHGCQCIFVVPNSAFQCNAGGTKSHQMCWCFQTIWNAFHLNKHFRNQMRRNHILWDAILWYGLWWCLECTLQFLWNFSIM